jgi:hypothetical protein
VTPRSTGPRCRGGEEGLRGRRETTPGEPSSRPASTSADGSAGTTAAVERPAVGASATRRGRRRGLPAADAGEGVQRVVGGKLTSCSARRPGARASGLRARTVGGTRVVTRQPAARVPDRTLGCPPGQARRRVRLCAPGRARAQASRPADAALGGGSASACAGARTSGRSASPRRRPAEARPAAAERPGRLVRQLGGVGPGRIVRAGMGRRSGMRASLCSPSERSGAPDRAAEGPARGPRSIAAARSGRGHGRPVTARSLAREGRCWVCPRA